ncbi:Hsp33 family molecular chaperone HslO [Oribacterium sp. WCC10]|uniref:Hsp33 family molecular chaperone HslO n=1 Tax=Oribacterium sp. WCC10 TaxID=1855343 RepID=UPI0008E07375|nr:Hsp33 family molecular chaperone HslO [Oribacterium sp. WCC10]SFG54439.1 molecular chaperone Hsp33 [Oribacterium sp. WCC10]
MAEKIRSNTGAGVKETSAGTYHDYVVRATAANGLIRAFACTTKDLVEECRKTHNTFPICTAAIGRLMSSALMMGVDLKGARSVITLTVKGDGPIKGITATADNLGNVKGFVSNPNVLLPPNEAGHLNVGGALGHGKLSVIKDIGLREPYIGSVDLRTGEIAEDLTYYFAVSEQIPSSVGLGVLMNRNNTVRQSGGFIIQLMPDATEEVISKLEQKLSNVKPVTHMLDEGMTPEEMLRFILGDMELEINDHIPVRFKCNCSRDKVSQALISLGKKELEQLIDEGKPQDVFCDYCEKHYSFSTAELQKLYDEAR